MHFKYYNHAWSYFDVAIHTFIFPSFIQLTAFRHPQTPVLEDPVLYSKTGQSPPSFSCY